jgi:hypothetical protein
VERGASRARGVPAPALPPSRSWLGFQTFGQPNARPTVRNVSDRQRRSSVLTVAPDGRASAATPVSQVGDFRNRVDARGAALSSARAAGQGLGPTGRRPSERSIGPSGGRDRSGSGGGRCIAPGDAFWMRRKPKKHAWPPCLPAPWTLQALRARGRVPRRESLPPTAPRTAGQAPQRWSLRHRVTVDAGRRDFVDVCPASRSAGGCASDRRGADDVI